LHAEARGDAAIGASCSEDPAVLENSLFFSLLAGNSRTKTGSHATACATTQSCMRGDFLTGSKNATYWRIYYPQVAQFYSGGPNLATVPEILIDVLMPHEPEKTGV
jgi:hypothetical protein